METLKATVDVSKRDSQDETSMINAKLTKISEELQAKQGGKISADISL